MGDADFIKRFRLLFQEKKQVSDDVLLIYKEMAENRMSEKRWGKLYKEGLLYLVAHFIQMNGGDDGISEPGSFNAKQEVTSKSIGKISKGMSSANSNNYTDAGDYATTKYGRYWWDLLQLLPTFVMVV